MSSTESGLGRQLEESPQKLQFTPLVTDISLLPTEDPLRDFPLPEIPPHDQMISPDDVCGQDAGLMNRAMTWKKEERRRLGKKITSMRKVRKRMKLTNKMKNMFAQGDRNGRNNNNLSTEDLGLKMSDALLSTIPTVNLTGYPIPQRTKALLGQTGHTLTNGVGTGNPRGVTKLERKSLLLGANMEFQ